MQIMIKPRGSGTYTWDWCKRKHDGTFLEGGTCRDGDVLVLDGDKFDIEVIPDKGIDGSGADALKRMQADG